MRLFGSDPPGGGRDSLSAFLPRCQELTLAAEIPLSTRGNRPSWRAHDVWQTPVVPSENDWIWRRAGLLAGLALHRRLAGGNWFAVLAVAIKVAAVGGRRLAGPVAGC